MYIHIHIYDILYQKLLRYQEKTPYFKSFIQRFTDSMSVDKSWLMQVSRNEVIVNKVFKCIIATGCNWIYHIILILEY